MAVSHHWRCRRSGRSGHPLLCRQPLAGPAPGHRASRMGGVAHDLHLRGDGEHRVRVREHCGRDAVACVTRDASRDGGQGALADAMAARDRECKGGVGKFCREREAAVTERRQAVDVAMRSIEQTADPQTESAIRIVAWASRGMLQPTGDDFAMLRLVLLALLPQIGGILLMVGRAERPS
jgi:hypothetical protein